MLKRAEREVKRKKRISKYYEEKEKKRVRR